MKHLALALIDATVTWEFEAPDDATPEQLEEAAWDQYPRPGLCHQCSDDLYIGDAGPLLEVDGKAVEVCG